METLNQNDLGGFPCSVTLHTIQIITDPISYGYYEDYMRIGMVQIKCKLILKYSIHFYLE